MAGGGGMAPAFKNILSKVASTASKSSSGGGSGSGPSAAEDETQKVPTLSGANIPGGKVAAKSSAIQAIPSGGNPGQSGAFKGGDPSAQAMANSQGMFSQLLGQANAAAAPRGVARKIQTFNQSNPTTPIDSKQFLRKIKDKDYRDKLKSHLGE